MKTLAKTVTKKSITFVIISIISLTTLTGCFGGSEEETVTPNSDPHYVTYEKSGLFIDAPSDWEVLTDTDFPSNVPNSTLAVFRNNIKNDVFTANLSITQSEIAKGTSSKDFALQTLNTQRYNLIGFQELSREDFDITKKTDETVEKIDTTYLVQFQARKTVTDPILEFKQFFIARNGFGIIITAAYHPSEDQSVVAKINTMLRSLQLK